MEIFKNILEYEGRYSVSNLWNVRSNNYRNSWESKNLKLCINRRWYNEVCLVIYWITQKYLVHRLVGITFLWYSELWINHKNWVRDDNRVENLEWCTQSYNMKHAYRELWVIPYNRGKKWKDCTNSKKVNQYTLGGEFIKTWDCIKEAEITLKVHSISRAIKNTWYTSWGFKWKHQL